jgi:peptide/nickel transport system substrate-binding protein
MNASLSYPRARWTPVAIVAVALFACKDVTPTTAGPNDIGGTMVVATASEPGTMMPTLVASQIDRAVTDLLYDRLADIGDDLNTIGDKGFKPQLAERWEWGKDSLSIAFHLNPRARWHDGVPVRASDVRYSLNLTKDPAVGSPALPLVSNVDSVSVRDSLTAVAWFKRRTPEQFYDLVYQVPIVPEHILGNTPNAQIKTSEVARRGIGSGRFRLARWDAGQRVELVADTMNYRGRPKLDRIVYAPNPDFNSAVTRFFAGDADMFEQLRPEQLARMKTDTVRRAVRYPTFQYSYFMFNFVDPKQPTRPHPIFSERAVRRALSMAVDRRAMLRNVFDTLGQPLYGPFPRSISVADTTVPQLQYDTTKARALLDSAGWVTGADGVRAKNGRRLEFAISTPSSSATRHQYAILLQDAFRRIGAAAKIDETDAASTNAKLNAHGFDAMLVNFATDPSVGGFKQSWSTAGIAKDGANYAAYSNPGVDALLDSATASFDPARTKSYARRAFETMIEDAPAIWLYEPPTVMGVDKRIRTANMRADGYWSGLADWWIPAAQRSARDKIGLRPTP